MYAHYPAYRPEAVRKHFCSTSAPLYRSTVTHSTGTQGYVTYYSIAPGRHIHNGTSVHPHLVKCWDEDHIQLTSVGKGLDAAHNMKLAQIRFFHSNYNSSIFTFFTILYTKCLLYADYTRIRHHTIQSVLRFNSRIKKI